MLTGRCLCGTVRYELDTVELEGRLMRGTTYTYWTFNKKVPGPFMRVRVGDTVEVLVRNPEDSGMIHSIDLHAVNGPGGGATLTQVPPGEERVFTFKALIPGLYVYHCATPMVAHHIASGMYGLILVEPEGGLAPVDREFYVMQGEIYTEAPCARSKISPITWKDDVKFGPPTPKKIRTVSPTSARKGYSPASAPTDPLKTKYSGASSSNFSTLNSW